MYTVLTTCSNDADNKILMRPSHSGGSRPSDKGGGGGNHPDRGIWGHWTLRASFWPKNKVEARASLAPFLDLPLSQ